MIRVWIAQCLCPQRHAIMAASREAEDQAEAEETVLKPLQTKMADMLRSGAINPWCGLCRSPLDAWRYEVGRTRFRSMQEAEHEMKRIEAEQALVRAVLGKF